MENSLKWVLFNIVSGQITSDVQWKYSEVFFIENLTYFLFLRAVVDIPIQTLLISP